MNDIVPQLQQLLPGADIRTDQCETVRIYWKKRIGLLRKVDDGIEARVILMKEGGSADIDPEPYIVDIGWDETEAANKLAKWLQRVAAAGW